MDGQDTRTAHAGTHARSSAARWGRRLCAVTLLPVVAAAASLLPLPEGFAAGMGPETIVEEWSSVKVPPPPAVKTVTVDPRTTAYLILDILRQTCNPQTRPRCVASVPRIAALLGRASGTSMLVVYTHIFGSAPGDILPAISPFPGQPTLQGPPDKFLGTNLDTILKDANIKTVILAGTDAAGAVLTMASEAAQRGYQVIVPLDLMSSSNLYAEQYTVVHLTNSPVIPARITLTRSDMIRF